MASLIAMPRLPGVSGISARILRPALVCVLGLAMHVAPQTCIMSLRKGFWSKLIRTMKTLHSSPMSRQAKARALPH
jgi:hypothetical protein